MQDSTGSLILSPRLVATGDPAGDALENLNTNVLADGSLVYVGSGPGQGEWQLQKGSSDAPNGTTIVSPIAGPGRWFRKSNPGPVPGVPTLAQVAAAGNSAGGLSLTNLGAPAALTSALRLGDIFNPLAIYTVSGVGPGGAVRANLSQQYPGAPTVPFPIVGGNTLTLGAGLWIAALNAQVEDPAGNFQLQVVDFPGTPPTPPNLFTFSGLATVRYSLTPVVLWRNSGESSFYVEYNSTPAGLSFANSRLFLAKISD
jgi:hypothetical protein